MDNLSGKVLPDTDCYCQFRTGPHIACGFCGGGGPVQAECKAALQQELGLQVRPDVPLIGFIGRLDWQKGPDILQAALPELMTDDVQFVKAPPPLLPTAPYHWPILLLGAPQVVSPLPMLRSAPWCDGC